MAVTAPVTIRIGRIVVEGAAPADANRTAAALRTELVRLVSQGGLPQHWGAAAAGVRRDPATLHALTPGGRGREAAGRMFRP